MVSPDRTTFELESAGTRLPSGGQELQSRAGEVLQVAWFDALPAESTTVQVWRNGHRLGGVEVTGAGQADCPDLDSSDVRVVGCGWIDVLEWTLPPRARVDVSAPIDAVIRDGDGNEVPFWRFQVRSESSGLVVRFGVGRLHRGRYEIQVAGETALGTHLEVR